MVNVSVHNLKPRDATCPSPIIKLARATGANVEKCISLKKIEVESDEGNIANIEKCISLKKIEVESDEGNIANVEKKFDVK
jgi:hypothetical protein